MPYRDKQTRTKSLRLWRSKWTPEQRAAHNQACADYRRRNPEKHKHAVKRWRINNLERTRLTTRLWELAHPEKAKAKWLRRQYNISPEERNKILEAQGKVCAGCKRPESDFKRALSVDHDHSTHIIRGLLCWQCNSLLPSRRNIKEVFKNLMIYLDDPPAVKALGEERKANPIRRKRSKK